MKKANENDSGVWYVTHNGNVIVNGHNGGNYKTRRSAMLACKRLVAKGVNAIVVSSAMYGAAQHEEV